MTYSFVAEMKKSYIYSFSCETMKYCQERNRLLPECPSVKMKMRLNDLVPTLAMNNRTQLVTNNIYWNTNYRYTGDKVDQDDHFICTDELSTVYSQTCLQEWIQLPVSNYETHQESVHAVYLQYLSAFIFSRLKKMSEKNPLTMMKEKQIQSKYSNSWGQEK